MSTENKNPNLIKNGGSGTKVGNFLRGLKKNILPSVLDAVGVGDMARAMNIISEDPNNAGLTVDEAKEFYRLVELELKDMNSARQMYGDSGNDTANFIAKRVINWNLFVVVLAILIEITAVIYITDKVLIAIVSSAVGAFTTALLQERQQVINFFFGSSLGSKAKTDQLNKK